jgi:hypothetical protein
MTDVRVLSVLSLVVVLAGGRAEAQTADSDDKAWALGGSVTTYVLPDSPNYVQPTIGADYARLHLEARVNYEGLSTGSAWLGYTFSTGESLTLEITPMVGAIFGSTKGVAPGYEATLGWRAVELSSEAEYVFDEGDSANSFLYTWSELAVAPAHWYRFGLVVQRTKAYRTQFDIQRGFLVGLSCGRTRITGYVFNPGTSGRTLVIGVMLGP